MTTRRMEQLNRLNRILTSIKTGDVHRGVAAREGVSEAYVRALARKYGFLRYKKRLRKGN